MAETVTTMRLKVDLQCSCGYKKVKKILCKFPASTVGWRTSTVPPTMYMARHVRHHEVYDEKQNLVTITVVCCSPEKIRDKLCCKGGKVIKSIEIVKPPPSPDPKPSKSESKSETKSKPEPKPEPEPKPCSHPPIPVVFCCVLCSKGFRGGRCCCRYWPPVPPPCRDGHGCGCGCGCEYRDSHCDYFSEQITGECTIM